MQQIAEYIYIALSSKYCHTPLLTSDQPKPIYLSKHRFKVAMNKLVDKPGYEIILQIEVPDIRKFYNIKYILSNIYDIVCVDYTIIKTAIYYFENELKKVFVRVQDTEMTRVLYEL